MLLHQLQYASKRQPIQMTEKIHRVIQAPPQPTIFLIDLAGMVIFQLERAIDGADASCEICLRSSWLSLTRKISLSHVSQAFNIELQIDFLLVFSGTRS